MHVIIVRLHPRADVVFSYTLSFILCSGGHAISPYIAEEHRTENILEDSYRVERVRVSNDPRRFLKLNADLKGILSIDSEPIT